MQCLTAFADEVLHQVLKATKRGRQFRSQLLSGRRQLDAASGLHQQLLADGIRETPDLVADRTLRHAKVLSRQLHRAVAGYSLEILQAAQDVWILLVQDSIFQKRLAAGDGHLCPLHHAAAKPQKFVLVRYHTNDKDCLLMNYSQSSGQG